MNPTTITFGRDNAAPSLALEVLGYEHPDTVEPANLDLMRCRVTAQAGPVLAPFDIAIALWELLELRDYLAEINSGNGPGRTFALAGGLLSLSLAPTRRGPVLCAVMLKTIDASHVRLEFLITLEPRNISRTLLQFSQLQIALARSGTR